MIIWPLKSDYFSENELEQMCRRTCPLTCMVHSTYTQLARENLSTQLD